MAVAGVSRRGVAMARLVVVIVAGVVLAGCSPGGDDSAEATIFSSPVTEETTPSTETADQDASVAETDEAISSGGVVEDAVPSTSTSVVDETADQNEPSNENEVSDEDPVITITTTPPATTVVNDDADDETAAVETVVPVTVPGPTVAAELEEEANFGTGVLASIASVEAVDVEGRLPGERSGPGVLVTVEVDNASDEAISLDFVTVDLIRANGGSAIPVDSLDGINLTGDLAPGASAVGQYQFFIPVEERDSATITVHYASGVPTALFSGDLPNA